MRVTIDRNVCPAHLSFCERCLGKFLKEPLGYDRRCFEVYEDDGNDEILTLEIHTGDDHVILQLDAEQREMVAAEGWSYFVEFGVPQYRG